VSGIAFDLPSIPRLFPIRFYICIEGLTTLRRFGPASTIEEGGLPFILRCYETNVFGPVKVTNAIVPYMRSGLDGKEKGKGGMILFIGSRSAWKTGAPVRMLSFISSPFVTHSTRSQSTH
jgi:NAD(P)-dependent dehydrogenase (short-subunit alcohol dehydrogenase family)